jgi:ribosome-associated protein
MNRNELLAWIEQAGSFTFSRSGGPGGQNVNKVNTKAILRLPLCDLPVSDGDAARVMRKLDTRLTTEGELVIHSSEGRSQRVNRELAMERAVAMIAGALRKPRQRKRTKPSRAAKERRLAAKRHRSEIKRRRRPPPVD